VCRACPVQVRCDALALDVGAVWGLWAGQWSTRAASAGQRPERGVRCAPDPEERVVSFGFRKSIRLGPLRLTASKRGVTASTGLGPLRVSRSSRGRHTKTVRVPGTGVFWRSTRKR